MDDTTLVAQVENNMVDLLNKGEIDMQIATAHKFPRSVVQFRTDVMDMVTISEAVARECIYALPRGGKVIEGASARFAEIVASAWGNSRAGARVVDDRGNFVTAQGVFHDLQRNVCITYEVQRSIVDKYGKRFSNDMIGVTSNAACSVALRNAILKGVPKAFWSEMYDAARQTVAGDVKTLPTRRAAAFERFMVYGVSKETILEFFDLKGEEDLGTEQLLVLTGMFTAIKEGDTTPEQAFLKASNASPKASVEMPQSKSKSAPPPQPSNEKASTSRQSTKANSDGEVLASDGEKAIALQKLEAISIKPAAALEILGVKTPFESISATDVKALIDFANEEANEMSNGSSNSLI